MADTPTVDKVKTAYQNDEINARQYHQALWQLSRQTFEERVLYSGGTIGAAKAVVNQVWDDWRTRYDEIQQANKSAAIEGQLKEQMKKTGQMPEAIYATPETFGERMWKDLNAAMAPMNRVAELSGNGWKQVASAVGAPDWMAKLIGFAAETSASFVMSGSPIANAQAQVGTRVKQAGRAIKDLAATKIAGKAAEGVASEAAAIPEQAQPIIDGINAAASAVFTSAKESPAVSAEVMQPGKDFLAGQEAVQNIANHTNPLQARLANFAKSSAEQARGMATNSQRGGLRRATHAVTAERAAALPAQTLEQVGQTAAGTTMNAEQIIKSQAPFKEPMAQLLELAPKVAGGDPDAGPAFEALVHRMLDPTEAIEAVKTEIGRATEILKATTPIHEQIANLHDVFAAFGPEAAATGNWDKARANLAAKITELGTPEDIQKVFDIANANLKGEKGKNYGDLFRQAYGAVLLAKPATWVKKTLGDVQGAFDKTLQYSFGGYLSPDDKGLLNSDGPLAARTMLASMWHNMGNTVNAPMQEAFDFATKSRDIPDAMAAFVGKRNAQNMSGFFDYGGDPERWNVPGKVFNGITGFAQNVGSTFGQYMNAHREGIKLGFGNEMLNEFVANRMAFPTKEMLMEGISAGGEITYTNPMGGLGQAVQKAVQGWGPAWMITPFFHIPANLVNRAFSNIPVVSLFTKGVVNGLESGGVERDLQLGRLAMAQMSSQMMWLMAKGGLMTGHGPNDPKERQVWMENGNKPYSFIFGKTAIPYGFLGSLGIQASVIADTAYMSDYFDQPSLENATGSLLISGARAVANEPFFESWGRLASAMQDPEKSGLKSLGDGLEKMALTPVAVTTGGPVVATAARALDPFSKSVDNALDDIKQTIPVLREGVPNRLNPLTAQKESLPAPWGVGWLKDSPSIWAKVARTAMGEVNPMTSYDLPVSKDPVINEMARVGASFPNFRVNYGSKATITGAAPEPGQAPPINLTAAESEDLIKQFATRKFDGEVTVRQFLEQQMADPSYNEMPPAQKQKMFDSILRGNNAQAFNEFKATHPDVAYRYAVSGLQKILSAVPGDERQQLEQEYLQGQNEALQSQNAELQSQVTDQAETNYNQSQQQNQNAPEVPQ